MCILKSQMSQVLSNTAVKMFFSTKASGGFVCPRQILVGGAGGFGQMLFCKVDQSWHIKIFLCGHFFRVREPQFSKNQSKGTEKGAE